MHNKNAVNWFEIPTRNLAEAKRFYEDVFRVRLKDHCNPLGTNMAIFPGDEDSAGATGALIETAQIDPCKGGTIVYFRCYDLEEELRRVQEFGSAVLLPKTSIGENGYIAHFLDISGNRVGLHSRQ